MKAAIIAVLRMVQALARQSETHPVRNNPQASGKKINSCRVFVIVPERLFGTM